MGVAEWAGLLKTSTGEGIVEFTVGTTAGGAVRHSFMAFRRVEGADRFAAAGKGLVSEVVAFEALAK
jgi:hypothetical protein